MNIPVIPVGDVTQGLPAGAIQSVTSGTLAGALSEDFAITFGATLRQSEQQGNALLQQGDAKGLAGGESVKLAPARTSQASVPGTTDVQAVKQAGPVSISGADGLKTNNLRAAVDSQTNAAGKPVVKDSVQSATASVDDKNALSKAEYEAQKVLGVDKTVISSNTKTAETAKSELLATSNKTIAQLKTNSAILRSFLKEPISLTAPLEGSSDSGAAGLALTSAAVPATDPPSAGPKDELAVTLPNNLATVNDLKDELSAGIKVSRKVEFIPSVVAGTSVSTHSVAAKTAIVPGTVAKLQAVKTAVKAEQESTASSVLDTAAAQAFPAISPIPLVFTPTAKPAETLAAPLSVHEIKNVGANSGWATKDLDPANPDLPVIAEISAGKASDTTRSTANDGTDKAIVAKSGTDFLATERIAAPTVSTPQYGSTAVTPVYSNPLTTSTIAALSAPTVDRTVKNVQQAIPNSNPAVTTAITTGPQQGSFHLGLKTPTQATGTEAARADSESNSVQQSSVAAATLDNTAATKPIEERAVTAVTEVAKTTTENVTFQEPLGRVKLPSANSTTQQSAQSDISSAVSTTVTPAVSTAGVHASDRAASMTPAITTNAALVNSAVSGLQAAAPATTAISSAHSAATATASTPTGSLSAIEAGRISATSAPSTAEPYKTIVATPTALEVGVPNGTQGWLRIRAEVGDQGGVNASLAAGSNASQEMLHRQLPALNEYLHSEQISVTTSVTDRVFAAAGSSLAGMAAGSNGAGSDASGRSMNQDATANQGPANQSAMTMNAGNQDSGTQGNGGRHDVAPAFETVAIDDSRRNYDNRIGASDTVAAQTARDGESGRWLNVRA